MSSSQSPRKNSVAGRSTVCSPVSTNTDSSQLNEHPWNIKDIGLNAISGILNDPNQKKVKKPSLLSKGKSTLKGMDNLPSIPQTPIPKVKYSSFDPYIQEIEDVFNKYTINQEEKGSLVYAKKEAKQQSIEVVKSKVPEIFFSSEFNPSNPHSFSIISENMSVSSAANSDTSVNTLILQEKLSYYLDTVEVDLIKEISKRSESFFAALSNLQSLHSETQLCVSKINTLRQNISELSDSSARTALDIISLNTQKEELNQLYQECKMVGDCFSTRPMIDELINRRDMIGALDLIEETLIMIHGEKNNELKGVKCLNDLSAHLSETASKICSSMENEFLETLLHELDTVIDAMDNTPDGDLPYPNTPAYYCSLKIKSADFLSHELDNNGYLNADDDEIIHGKLFPLVFGLLRMNDLGNVLDNYKHLVLKRVKALSKKYYSEFGLDVDSLMKDEAPDPHTLVKGKKKMEQESLLAKNFRSMTFRSFSDFLVETYSSLLYYLQKIANLDRLLSKIILEAQASGVIIGNQLTALKNGDPQKDEDIQEKYLNDSLEDDEFESLKKNDGNHQKGTSFQQLINSSADIVYNAIDLTHIRISKIIGVRNQQNAKLSKSNFFNFYAMTLEFVRFGELLNGGRSCFGLKSTMLSQAKAFLTAFHEEKSKQIVLLVENEQWSQAEVPTEFQNIINSIIVSSGESIPNEVLASSADSLVDDPEQSFSKESGSMKYLLVNNKKFYSVGCLLIFMKTITDYMSCIYYIPVLYNDVLNRILEVLKLFNSRICQVVLGAGAMRSAGLKNITARHIALATQCLGVVIALIPFIKSSISTKIPLKQQVFLNEFDRILKDYTEHQNELFNKLVAIMNERLVVHCKNLTAIDWDTPDQKDFASSDSVSNHIAMLVKETTTLHKVLNKYLSKDTLKKLFGQVFKSYASTLAEELMKLDLFTSAAKNRLLTDVQYFITSLSSLEGIDGPGNHLEVVVNNHKIKDKRATLLSRNSISESSSSALEFEKTLTSNIDVSAPVNMNRSSSESSRKLFNFGKRNR